MGILGIKSCEKGSRSMEEINIKDLFHFFVKKIPAILVITLLVFSVGLVYSVFLKTPLYSGNTTLILVKKDNGYNADGMTQNDIVLNQKLVTTYSEIIKSRRVLNQVVKELNLDYSSSALSKKISVSSVSDTEIIKISVSDESATLAAIIADTIADVFKDEVMEIYSLENVSIIDEAEVAENPYNISLVKELVIYLLIGFVLSCGVYFVVYYFDNSIKSSEEIEARLGVAVIGSIPLSRGGVK